MNHLRNFLLLGVLAGTLVLPAVAQDASGWDPRGAELKRTDLDSLFAQLNRAAGSSAYSETLRKGALQQAKVVQERLHGGDFQPGDRILLRVEGEPTLTDTFLVALGPVVPLPAPVSRDISLDGVLRSELAPYLKGQIAAYVRDPVVHARSLVRLSVIGGVPRPGFFVVPADTPLPDVLMLAGGWSPDANLRELRVDRGTERLWDGDALQQATREGRTVDQMSLRAGDQIVVPRRGGADLERIARIVTAVIALPAAIYAAIQLFN